MWETVVGASIGAAATIVAAWLSTRPRRRPPPVKYPPKRRASKQIEREEEPEPDAETVSESELKPAAEPAPERAPAAAMDVTAPVGQPLPPGAATTAAVWHSLDASVWEKALYKYWDHLKPSEIEFTRRIEAIRPDDIRKYDARQWYDYLLNEYFRWKYTAKNRYGSTTKFLKKLDNRDGLARLLDIKDRLFAFDRRNIAEGLRIAQEIPGLGPAGASGLLALLFPEDFATVDQFVVKALLKIPDLPERPGLLKMVPESLTPDQGMFLIELMRRKAAHNNTVTKSGFWTPRRIDIFLWTFGHDQYI